MPVENNLAALGFLQVEAAKFYASIYEFRDLQILLAETCKNPKAAKLFSTGTYG